VLDVLPRPSDDDNPIGGISMVRSFCTFYFFLYYYFPRAWWWLVVVVVAQCLLTCPALAWMGPE